MAKKSVTLTADPEIIHILSAQLERDAHAVAVCRRVLCKNS